MLFKVRNLILPVRVNQNKIKGLFYSTSTVTKPKEKRIQIKDWDINYLKVGNGPHHLFCMPGALGSIWTDFKPQVEGLDREQFTLVVWDPPGYGKSSPPLRDFPANLYERDADYAFEFMKALNIPKYSVLAWSDGGTSSLLLAAKYPQVVHKLVAFSTNSFILPQELEFYKTLKDIRSWSQKMKQPMVDLYGEELLARYWASWVEGQVTVYNAASGDICSALLKDITCPTFILYGQKDPIVDSSHITYFKKNIKNLRIHMYPEGKHNIHLAYPEDFNKRVSDFLLG